MTTETFRTGEVRLRQEFRWLLVLTLLSTCWCASTANAAFVSLRWSVAESFAVDELGNPLSPSDVGQVADLGGGAGSVPVAAEAPKEPQRRPLDERVLVGLPPGTTDSGSSGSSSSNGSSRTVSSTPLFTVSVAAPDVTPIGRLSIHEDIRLPPKLPYKLFRPPKS